MLSKGSSRAPGSFDTIIGINSTFEGNIKTEGTIRIDGKIIGDLRINGDVYVGKDASISGNIYASNIYVSGKVDGNIEAKGVLRIHASAKLCGDISVYSLVTEEGSFFDGNCKMLAVAPVEEIPRESNVKKFKSNNKVESH